MKKNYILLILALFVCLISGEVFGQCITGFSVKEVVDVSCKGGNDGEITIEVNGGTGPFTFDLFITTGKGTIVVGQIANTMDSTVTFSLANGNVDSGFGIPAIAENYEVRVVSSNPTSPLGCNKLSLLGIVVSEPAEALSATAVTQPDCGNGGTGSIDLTVIGGTSPYTYAWSNGLPDQEDQLGTVSTGTYEVTITDTLGCTFTLKDIEVAAGSEGGTLTPAAITVCSGDNSGNINLSSQRGTILRWESSTDNFTSDINDIGNAGNTVFTFTDLPQTTYYRAAVQSPGCLIAYSSITSITTETLTLANAGTDQTVCEPAATLNANAIAAGETGQWTVLSGAGSVADDTNPGTAVSGLSAGTNEFVWTISNATCPASSDTVTIVFNDITIADAGTDQVICEDEATLSANIVKAGETGAWTVLSGTGSFADANDPGTAVTGLSEGNNSFIWKISDNSGTCPSNQDTVVISREEITLADAGPDQTVCDPAATLNANAIAAGETGQWTVLSGAGSVADDTNPGTAVSGLSAGTNEFVWTISNATCPASSDTVTIVFNDITIADAGTDQVICEDEATLSANIVKAGETGAWIVLSGTGSFADANDPGTAVTGLSVGNNSFIWRISDNSGTCPSNQDTVVISREEITLANAGTDQTVCDPVATLNANSVATGETGQWTVLSGAGSIADDTNPGTAVSGLSAGTNEFVWTISNATCPASSDTVTIVFNDITIADAGTDQVICEDEATLSANIVKAGETGNWTVLSGTGSFADANDPGTAVTGLSEGNNSFIWRISDNSGTCPSNQDTVVIGREEITLANAGTDQTVCDPAATLNANSVATGETGQWTVLSGAGSVADDTNPGTAVSGLSAGTNEFVWTISNATCPASSDTVTIVFNDITIADAGTDQVICEDEATLSANIVKAGETGNWTVLSGTGSFADANDPGTAVTGLSEGNNSFIWRISDNSGTCPSNQDTVVIGREEITLANAGTDQTVCDPAATLNANAIAAGETGQWIVLSGAGSIADDTNPGTAVSGLSAGTNEFVWTISNATCPASSDTVVIIFNDLTVADAGDDQIICEDEATLSANIVKAGETGTWTVLSGSGSFADANDPGTAVTGLSEGNNAFIWTVSDGVCLPNQDTVVIRKEITPIADAGGDITACEGDNITLDGSGSTTGPDIVYLWTGPGGFTSNQQNLTINNVAQAQEGIYILTVTNSATGCDSTDQVEVIVNELPIALDQNLAVCESVSGSGTAEADLTAQESAVTGGATGVTVKWYADAGLTVAVTDPTAVTVNNADIYYAVVQSVNCQDTATLTYTVSNLPTALDQNPAVCEDISGSGAAEVDLRMQEPAITANASVVTIEWYADSGLTMAVTDPVVSVGNGDSYYALVLNAACQDTAKVTYTVNSLPVALDQDPEICEDVPGSGSAEADLTLQEPAITGGATVTVTWYSDSNLATVVADPTAVTVSDGHQYYALLQGATCSDTAVVTYTVNELKVPAVTIVADNDTVCTGTEVKFTATPANGGDSPVYQWFINNMPKTGATGSTFASAGLNDGDKVNVIMIPGGTMDDCNLGSPASSNIITISMPSELTPSVAIAASDTVICAGTEVTFTVADSTNSGSDPSFQWFLNGTALSGEMGVTYKNSSLAQNDEVSVEMTIGGAGIGCITGSPVMSNTVSIDIASGLAASVTVAATDTVICGGTPVTFTVADSTNSGSDPTFQWYLNGAALAGETGNAFTSLTLAQNDAVSVEMTIDGTDTGCITGSPVMSNIISMDIASQLAASVTIAASDTVICTGTPVTFTVADSTNSGSDPTFQWYLNGAALAGEAGNIFTSSTLAQNDAVSVEMTIGGTGIGCVTGSPVMSNIFSMDIASQLAASVTIAASDTVICGGTPVTFTVADSTNSGSDPTFQWYLNGAALAGETGNTFASSTLAQNDAVSVEMTIGGTGTGCITGSPVMSNIISMDIASQLAASVTIEASDTVICGGTPVTFTVADSTNSGSDASFQWYLNGAALAGETGNTFASSTLAQNDAVSVEMTIGGIGTSCVTGSPVMSNIFSMDIASQLAASVTIAASDTVICAGTEVTFTVADSTNSGSDPSFQWFLNGTAIAGETGATYKNSTLAQDNTVSVEMTIGGTGISCITGSPVMSNALSIDVPAQIPASVTIAATDTVICAGTEVTFAVTDSTGSGSDPSFQWYVNGAAIAGDTANTFVSSTLAQNDEVSVEMTIGGTGIGCVTGSPVMSNIFSIDIASQLAASVTIEASDTVICAGTPVTFTVADSTNSGSDPSFQWYVNGAAIAGDTANTFVSSTLAHNDEVSVEMTIGGTGIGCVTGSPVMSNIFSIDVASQLAASATIEASDTVICAGAEVTFTVTDSTGSGSDPSFQWYVNGAAIAGETGNNFVSSTLAQNNTVSVEMTIGGTGTSCVTGSPVMSNIFSIDVPAQISASVAIAASDTVICAGTKVTFSVSDSTGSGSDPSFQWYINGLAQAGQTANTFTSSTLAQNDAVSVEMTSGGTGTSCVTGSPVMSGGISMDVPAELIASIEISASSSVVCAGEVVTFSVTTSENGGSSPAYQWYVNDTPVSGATAETYSASNLSDGDTVWIAMTPGGDGVSCVSNIASSPAKKITVRAAGDPACGGGDGQNCGAFTFQFNNTPPSCGNDDGRIVFSGLTYNGTIPPVMYGLRKVGDAVYDMQPNDTVFEVLGAGEYEYMVKNLDNDDICSGTINLRPATTVTATATDFMDATCYGTPTGKARINATGSSTGKYFYSIDGTTWELFVTGSMISDLPPNGTYSIYVGEVEFDNCPDEVEVTINNANSPIEIIAQSTDATCNVNDGSITVTNISGGVPPYEIALKREGETVLAYQPFESMVTFGNVGKGYRKLFIKDNTGCVVEKEQLVNAPNLVLFEVTSTDPTCQSNGTDGSFIVEIQNYDSGKSYEYAISTGEPNEEFLPVNNNNFVIEDLVSGTYKIYIRTAEGQCVNEQEGEIAGGATAVSFAIETTDIQCKGGNGGVLIKEITGSGDEDYRFKLVNEDGEVSEGAISKDQALFGFYIDNLSVGDYKVWLLQQQPEVNCEVKSTMLEFVINGPTQSIRFDTEMAMSLPDRATGSVKIYNVSGGMAGYTVTIKDFNPIKPEQNGQYSTAAFPLEPTIDGIHYETTLYDLYAGEYTLSLKDEFGCEQELTVWIDYDKTLFIPNVFTPNDDGVNDTFVIRNIPDAGTNLIVTNRWGKVVFKATDYDNSWTGDDLSDGVYYYKLMLSDGEGFSGYIEIWRGRSIP